MLVEHSSESSYIFFARARVASQTQTHARLMLDSYARDSVAYKSYKISDLDYWRDTSNTKFPQLTMMIRDTLAVSATRAGVEREFRCTIRYGKFLRTGN